MNLELFEQLAAKLFTASTPQERAGAETALVRFTTQPEHLLQCKYVLDHSRQPYAQLVAANALKQLLLQSWNQMPPQQRIDFRNYTLSFLANRGVECEQFVTQSLVQLIARITKMGWFESDEHRNILDEVSKFLHATPTHLLIGLQLFSQLVAEMNATTNTRSLTQHRKVTGAFRDGPLFQVVTLALHTLTQVHSGATSAGELMPRVTEAALQVVLACLSYDFIGTTLDEASEEMGTIQVPSSWRAAMQQPQTTQLFFDLHLRSSPPISSLSLEALVQLASLRRSLFSSDEERQAFLCRMMRGALSLLQAPRGLSERANYHELCRLLARLKANYQLSELVQADCYAEWLDAVAKFTIESFFHWQWATNSVHYLLSLWSRLVASMPYLKGDAPSRLEEYVPQVIRAFISSRMELVRALLVSDDSAELDDPLDDEEQLSEQLETVPSLCRFQLESLSTYVLTLFEPCAALYQQLLARPAAERTSRELQLRLAQSEGELAWLVYLIGTVLGSHLTPSCNSETHQLIDGELACVVLQLIPLIDAPETVQERRLEKSNAHLQLALVYFLQQFRKVYIGDQATASSKVYLRLAERLHLADHVAVLSVVTQKIVTNLRLRSDCLHVTQKTLALFGDLAAGFCTGKLMLKLDVVHSVLQGHTDFPFLRVPANARHRTTFYATLTKLLFAEDTTVRFKSFIGPFSRMLSDLAELPEDDFKTQGAQEALCGVLRDLRGVCSSCSNRRSYNLFFSWVYPSFTPLFLRACAVWYDVPALTTALLKFYCELVYNKQQRLTFDSSSPNGILLFRDTSQLVVCYGSRILEHQPPAGADPYAHRHKGIAICLLLLTRALSGNYVNFGVFALYGDRALADCLAVTIKLCLAMSLEEIMAFPKVGKAYFALIELLMRNHTPMIVELETPVLQHICRSLREGLQSHEVAISSQCAASLEHLAAFHFRTFTEETREEAAKAQLQDHLAREPTLFSAQLASLLHMVVFEECANQASGPQRARTMARALNAAATPRSGPSRARCSLSS